MRHDIALIELTEAAKMTKYVDTVCLPSRDMIGEDLIEKKVEIVSFLSNFSRNKILSNSQT